MKGKKKVQERKKIFVEETLTDDEEDDINLKNYNKIKKIIKIEDVNKKIIQNETYVKEMPHVPQQLNSNNIYNFIFPIQTK